MWRGSFGFVLHEASANGSVTGSALRQVVDDVTGIMLRMASTDEAVFEEAAESLDPRLLAALQKFFAILDDRGATLRIVEGERDEALEPRDVKRARARTEAIEIVDRETSELRGILMGVLPEHRRFELRRLDTGELIWGTISPDVSAAYEESLASKPLIGTPVRVRMSIREVKKRNQAPHVAYTLTDVLQDS